MGWHKFLHNPPIELSKETQKDVTDFLNMKLVVEGIYATVIPKDGEVTFISFALPKQSLIPGLSKIQGRINYVNGLPKDDREYWTPQATNDDGKITLSIRIGKENKWTSVPEFKEIIGWKGNMKSPEPIGKVPDTTPKEIKPEYRVQIDTIAAAVRAGIEATTKK